MKQIGIEPIDFYLQSGSKLDPSLAIERICPMVPEVGVEPTYPSMS